MKFLEDMSSTDKIILACVVVVILFFIFYKNEIGASVQTSIQQNSNYVWALLAILIIAYYIWTKNPFGSWENEWICLERCLNKNSFLATIEDIKVWNREKPIFRRVESRMAYIVEGYLFPTHAGHKPVNRVAIMISGDKATAGDIIDSFDLGVNDKTAEKLREKTDDMEILRRAAQIKREWNKKEEEL